MGKSLDRQAGSGDQQNQAYKCPVPAWWPRSSMSRLRWLCGRLTGHEETSTDAASCCDSGQAAYGRPDSSAKANRSGCSSATLNRVRATALGSDLAPEMAQMPAMARCGQVRLIQRAAGA